LRAATTLIVVRGLVRSIVLLVVLVVIISIYVFAVACRTQARIDFDNFVFGKLLRNFCHLAYVRLGEHDASSLEDLAVVEDDLVPGPVKSIVFSFRNGMYISLNSSTSAGHVYLHVYQYEIYLENTGRNQFRI